MRITKSPSTYWKGAFSNAADNCPSVHLSVASVDLATHSDISRQSSYEGYRAMCSNLLLVRGDGLSSQTIGATHLLIYDYFLRHHV